jgi:hypothetical protein
MKYLKILMASVLCISLINGCKKEMSIDDPANKTDKLLYDMSKSNTGFIWYKKSDALLTKSSGSAHPQSFLRTRYNAVAATKLDGSGRIMQGVSFPEGSLIVKELYENSTTLTRYAILYKKSDNPDADAKGWVWGYINADGGVADPSSNKGRSCISCHSQNGNIDYMLMNKFFQ